MPLTLESCEFCVNCILGIHGILDMLQVLNIPRFGMYLNMLDFHMIHWQSS